MTAYRLAVWGDPIAHSQSPHLHAAAYRVLGLDWEYGRDRVSAEEFDTSLSALDGSWRGLSLTMPLKEKAFAAAVTRDGHAELTGAVNTLLTGTRAGFNTDVGGIIDALSGAGIAEAPRVRILGAGATASSALVAVAELGAERVEVRARRPESLKRLSGLGDRLGLHVSAAGLEDRTEPVDLTLATLPGGTVLAPEHSARLLEGGGALFEAAYAPWPSALAADWVSGPVISGLEMLLYQAVRQIRVFLHGDPAHVLDDEASVVAVMRSALVGD